ncbi:MAG: hypothetical protein R3B70_10530 [Polyangiaceae bacterium]
MKCRTIVVLALSVLGCGGSGGAWGPPPSAKIPVSPRTDELAYPKGKKVKKPAPPPAPAPPEAISGELPAEIDAKLVTHASCKDRQCLVAGLFPSGAAADGGAPVAIWSHDLPEKGTSLTFPKHSGVDLYGLVLQGKVKLRPLEPGAKGAELSGWGAFRAPGAGVTVEAVGGAARLVLAVAGDSAPIAETAALLKERKTLKKVAWSARPQKVETVDLKGSPDLVMVGGALHVRLGFETGRASFELLFASKNAPVPPHVHEGSWEILAPLWADGTGRRASSAGEGEMTDVAMSDGMVMAIPKGTLHAWVPADKKPLLAVQMYVPPGPEQRFKKLAADAAAKDQAQAPATAQ